MFFYKTVIWAALSEKTWTASSKKVPSNIHKMCRFRSFCACTKYHPGFCSPFIHFPVSNDSVSWEWRPWSDSVDVQADLRDLGLHCLYMPEHTFSHITKTRLFKYTENFTTKKGNFQIKKFWYFSYFCSKHRLWILVRTDLARRF